MLALRSLLALGTIAAVVTAQTSPPCFESNFGTNLGLSDDDIAIGLNLGFTFPFAGISTTAIDVASNGSIWVTTDPNHGSRYCDGDVFSLLNDGPSINPLWMDLDPSSGGSVWFNALPGRAVITWDNVPEYGGVLGMTFQVQLLADGTITFFWDQNCDAAFHVAVVGVSPGGGVTDPGASDLSASPILSQSTTLYEEFDALFGTPLDLQGMSLQLTPTGPLWLVAPRVGCVPAGSTRFGRGCPQSTVAYEEFDFATFDLANTAYLFTPTGAGYSVTTCTTNCFDPNFQNNLNLADDATSGPLNLGFNFNFPGGSSSAIDVSSNGFLWIDATQSFGDRCCDGDAATFLADPPSICPLWMDLDPSSGGGVYFDALPGRAMVTWSNVPEFGGGSTVDAQVQLFADGRVLIAFGAALNVNHIALTGISTVSGAADPGEIDFSQAVPFRFGGGGNPITLDAVFGSRPVLGTTFSMETLHLPAGTLLGVLGVGFQQLAVDLSLLGLEGCSLYQSGEATLPLALSLPSATVNLAIPNLATLVGASVYGQSIVVAPGVNVGGIATSNGLRITLGQ
ncbi:MAG: hypothetical protein AB7T19_17190 [Planctomycetota bacterium]